MRFGLSVEAAAMMVETLERQPGLRRAVVFGSRAKGSHTPGSDIDIAVWGLDEIGAEALRVDLEDLPLPWTFNVVAYDALAHVPLREHIDRVGQLFFERSPLKKPSL